MGLPVMIEVRLPIEQWQQVLAVLAQAPWATANPLIMSIGEQLRQGADAAAKGIRMPESTDGTTRQ
jgi:hypothetical protein